MIKNSLNKKSFMLFKFIPIFSFIFLFINNCNGDFIQRTLASTRNATFSILFPSDSLKGMPYPVGTGFFVSPDGWFITAAHVITKNGKPDGPIRDDFNNAELLTEHTPGHISRGCKSLFLKYVNSNLDFALIKVDFDANKNREWLKNKISFPYITVSSRPLNMAESVYSFGYPLSEGNLLVNNEQMTMGTISLCPRVTPAIISSTLYKTSMFMSSKDTKQYVLDRALNYGNSGGPIVSVKTGNVHAFCSRFQEVFIPQEHLKDQNGKIISVMIPSLYGVVISLGNDEILGKLKEYNIPISTR